MTRAVCRSPPEGGAVFLVPKDPSRLPRWRAHLYLETQAHAVDAVTGPPGYPADTYRAHFWDYAASHRVRVVEPELVDIGIQHADGDA